MSDGLTVPFALTIGALTIGGAYLIGGLVPLVPYMMSHDISTALRVSVMTTGVALLAFGAVKGHFTGVNRVRSAGAVLFPRTGS